MAANSGAGGHRSGLDVVEADDGNFNYDDRIVVETSQKTYRDSWQRPLGGVTNPKGPFLFTIEPMVDKYIQLNRAALEMTFQIVRADGSLCVPWEDIVAPVNLLGATLWESVEVSLNGQPFSGASSMNAGYKAFLESLLSYDTDARNTHLAAQMWHLDTPGRSEKMNLHAEMYRDLYVDGVRRGAKGLPELTEDMMDSSTRLGKIRREELTAWANATPAGSAVTLPQDEVVNEKLWDDEVNVLRREQMETLSKPVYEIELDFDVGDDKIDNAADKKKDPRLWMDDDREIRRKQRYRQSFLENIAALYQLIERHQTPVNEGFSRRFVMTAGSREFDLYAPISHDFFRLNNHIGPGNKLDLKFTMYPSRFLLNTKLAGITGGYELKLKDMKLHLHTIERKERIPPPVVERYLMNETQLHKQVVPKHARSANFRIHTGGVMPKSIILAFVECTAAEGSFDRNPFYLQHFGLQECSLIINGEHYPSDKLHTNFLAPTPLTMRAYHWMFENTGASDTDKGNSISWHGFCDSQTIIPFDLTPDRCNGLHNHDADYGFIDVSLRFADAGLRDPIYVLYEMVFNKVVINDKLTSNVIVLDVEGS